MMHTKVIEDKVRREHSSIVEHLRVHDSVVGVGSCRTKGFCVQWRHYSSIPQRRFYTPQLREGVEFGCQYVLGYGDEEPCFHSHQHFIRSKRKFDK